MPDWEAIAEKLAETPAARKIVEEIIPDVKAAGTHLKDLLTGGVPKTMRISPRLGTAMMQHAASTFVHPYLADMDAAEIFHGMDPEQIHDFGMIKKTQRWRSLVRTSQERIAEAEGRLRENEPIADHAHSAADRHAAARQIEADRRLIEQERYRIKHTTIPRLEPQQYNAIIHEPWFNDVNRRWNQWMGWAEGINKATGQRSTLNVPGGFSHLFHVDEEGTIPRNGAWKFDPALGVNVPLDMEDELAGAGVSRKGGRRGATPTRREKVGEKETAHTTGMAHGYVVNPVEDIRRWYSSRWPTYTKREMSRIAQEEGVARPLQAGERMPRTIEINGVEHPAAIKDWHAPVLPGDEDEVLAGMQPQTASTFVMPADVATEAENIDEGQKPMGALARFVHNLEAPIVGLHLSSPQTPVVHIRRIGQGLASNPITTDAMEHVVNTLSSGLGPVGTVKNALDEFRSPDGLKMYKRLLKIGSIRPNSFEAFDVSAPKKGSILEKVMAPEGMGFGDPLHPPQWLPDHLKPFWGMESQIRVSAALRYAKMFEKLHGRPPSDGEIGDFVDTHFGRYTPALQSAWVREFKKAGFPFLGFQSQEMLNEAGSTIGRHGIKTGGLAPGKKAGMALKTIAATMGPMYAVTSLANHALNGGKKPANVGPFDIYIPPDKSITGKAIIIPASSLFPFAERGSRISGIDAVLRAANDKGGLRQNLGRELVRDWGNIALGLPGPLWQTGSQAGLNARLHIVPEGPGEPPKLQQFETKTENGGKIPGVVQRSLDTTLQSNPVLSALVGMATPGHHGDWDFKSQGLGEDALRLLPLLGLPRTYGYSALKGGRTSHKSLSMKGLSL